MISQSTKDKSWECNLNDNECKHEQGKKEGKKKETLASRFLCYCCCCILREIEKRRSKWNAERKETSCSAQRERAEVEAWPNEWEMATFYLNYGYLGRKKLSAEGTPVEHVCIFSSPFSGFLHRWRLLWFDLFTIFAFNRMTSIAPFFSLSVPGESLDNIADRRLHWELRKSLLQFFLRRWVFWNIVEIFWSQK